MHVNDAYQPKSRDQIKPGALFRYPGDNGAELYLQAAEGLVVQLAPAEAPALRYGNRWPYPDATVLEIDAALIPITRTIRWGRPEPGDLIFANDEWYMCASRLPDEHRAQPAALVCISDGERARYGDDLILCFKSWTMVCSAGDGSEEIVYQFPPQPAGETPDA
jgi:hypothetical protein